MAPVILVRERPRHGYQVLIGLVTITIVHTTEEYDKFVNVGRTRKTYFDCCDVCGPYTNPDLWNRE